MPKEGFSLSPNLGKEYGIYLSPSHRYARNYGGNLIKVFVNIKNPFVINDKSEISPHDLKIEDIKKIQSLGYDGIDSGKEIIAFNSNQVWVVDIS